MRSKINAARVTVRHHTEACDWLAIIEPSAIRRSKAYRIPGGEIAVDLGHCLAGTAIQHLNAMAKEQLFCDEQLHPVAEMTVAKFVTFTTPTKTGATP
jgi:hypothetical protein